MDDDFLCTITAYQESSKGSWMRHTSAKNFPTLQDMCISRVVHSFKSYETNPTNPDEKKTNRISSLPLVLKEKLLRHLDSEHELIKTIDEKKLAGELAVLLINKQTTSFDFRACGLKDMSDMTWLQLYELEDRVWTKLYEEAPNMKKIRYRVIQPKPIYALASVLQMKNLEHLEFPHILFDNMRLDIVADNLKQLRYLNVCLLPLDMNNEDFFGIESLTKLEHLQHFIFHTRPYSYVMTQIIIIRTMKEMPHLRTVGLFPQPKKPDSDIRANHVLSGCTKLKIEQLVLKGGFDFPENCEVPCVRTVLIDEPEISDPDRLRRFPALEELYLTSEKGITFAEVMKCLDIVGSKLTKLEVNVNRDLFDLNLVLLTCPRLKHLSAHARGGFDVLRPVTNKMVQGKDLELESLTLELVNDAWTSNEPSDLQTNLLQQIVQAPNLKTIVFEEIYIKEKECEFVSNMVKSGEIFQKLRSFKYSTDYQGIYPTCYYTMFRTIAAFCPVLFETIWDGATISDLPSRWDKNLFNYKKH
ncbi:uncharacterized protein LOC132192458 isoform X2 [Neocloeon triangulifer]|uniref:uncharacterized protein LOC132192458 isoform X2 n=1 Tax=Neocloeon triangulifer TaxID=2078957 RepID=UPI00286F0550|nr:uncharacterized protein LOC132192458 isoform X2 [Neocloeon triangulifer]